MCRLNICRVNCVSCLYRPITCLHIFSSACGVRHKFRLKLFSVRLYCYLFCWRFMFYLCCLYLFIYTGVKHDFYIWWCSFRLTVTRWLRLVEQEPLTCSEYLSSLLIFSGVRVSQSLDFWSLFVSLSLFLCIVCSSSIYDFQLSFWHL